MDQLLKEVVKIQVTKKNQSSGRKEHFTTKIVENIEQVDKDSFEYWKSHCDCYVIVPTWRENNL